MTKQVAKYRNELNTVSMRKWKAEEMDFFFAIISKSRDQGTKLLKFSRDELNEIVHPDKNKSRVRQTLEQLADHIMNLRYYERTEKRSSVMALFQWFDVIWHEDGGYTAEVQVSERFEYILNHIQENFTQFPLSEFVQIKSTYSKTLYRMLKQYRQTGMLYLTQDEFKERLSIPESYKQADINKRILNRCLKELSPFFEDLKIEKEHAPKAGRPVKGYRFTWKPQEAAKWMDPEEYKATVKKQKAKSKDNLPDWYSDIPTEKGTEKDIEAILNLQDKLLMSGKKGREQAGIDLNLPNADDFMKY